MRMRKSEMRMQQSDKKTLVFEYEFSVNVGFSNWHLQETENSHYFPCVV